jgi:uncharacterized membrane protein YkvA (DUF1232 family)
VLELMKLLVVVSGVLALAFMILLALPTCKLRDMLMPYVAFGFAALCAAYAISPLDVIPDVFFPFGFVDDAAAIAAGVTAVVSTINAAKRKKIAAKDDPYFN